MKTGDTVLILSVRKSNRRAFDKLLQKGVNINAQNKKEKTALTEALRISQNYFTKQLIQAGANPNIRDIGGLSAYDRAK